ncbi:flagellar assembly peptidoglycan hydrolase FlgJ [Solimonas marina]|uniref:Peptidoglycan hydrolase FlgJ n=1 Tax=Solimonas marina TaxID=2714601 RepID=A0A970B7Z9_9GAMM|nr:flagellar assembly peptidoglycan hydrolase FlgJ [Solimonas marina]NKF21759.1 flagellar assembly peptidoglycan hydrolase FlgJ [Solimonas marina]
MTLRSTDAITDFSQFQTMRAGARDGDLSTVRKAAQQFEALFTQQLLKSMRAGSLGDDVMGGGQTGFYQDLFDQQMSVHLSSSGKGLGLADVLVQQLRGSAAGAADGDDSTATSVSGVSDLLSSARRAYALGRAQHATSALTATPPSSAATDHGETTTPESFVQSILPHAERAARELGVPARVLIAQAALETGWGAHGIKNGSGSSSHNLFGIKADRRWGGDSVSTTTTEVVDGTAQRERADFRAYDSMASSFDDYVDFLKSNPRYQEALQHGGSASRFVQGLQKAGYATDPAYARKILAIANGPTMQLALAAGPRQISV